MLALGLGLGQVATFFLSAHGESADAGTKPVQGWSDQDRQEFYHTSIGTQFIPYDWFLALRDYSLIDATGKPLKDYGSLLKDTAPHYGLIAETPRALNPDGLPVGMTKTVLADPTHHDPERKKSLLTPARIGFNCAFCHTSELMYDGKKLRIDGAASLQYNMRFLWAVLMSMKQVLKEAPAGEKFLTFAQVVLKSDASSPQAQGTLVQQLSKKSPDWRSSDVWMRSTGDSAVSTRWAEAGIWCFQNLPGMIHMIHSGSRTYGMPTPRSAYRRCGGSTTTPSCSGTGRSRIVWREISPK